MNDNDIVTTSHTIRRLGTIQLDSTTEALTINREFAQQKREMAAGVHMAEVALCEERSRADALAAKVVELER